MAAGIEQFSDDAIAVERLEHTATQEPQRFHPHTDQRIRDDRRRTAEISTMAAEVEAQGLTVVTENVLYFDYKGTDGPDWFPPHSER